MSEKHFLDLRGLGRVINKIISKIPTKTSDLINDKYFQTGAEVRSYVNAQSFGKVKNVNTGVGLTGGPITETGTIKANLVSETRLGSASEVVSDSDAKVYPVALDSQGKLSVAVPDTVVGAATESPTAIGNESVVGTSRKYAREDHTHNIDVTTGDANGQIKIAGQNVDVKGLGSIAYKDELVESDIPDLSSTYVKQGSDNDSHVEVTLDTTRTAKAYLLATTTPPIKTPTNVVAKADGSVYLDTKPGALSVGQRTSGNVGTSSFTNGNSLLATGNYSHAEGNWSEARGSFSHAEGNASVARGQHSHAEGSVTETTGVASHAEGNATKASGMYSHAEGEYTEARGEGQHVSGKYNIVDENNTYAEIVGNGDNSTRSNARTLDWNGNATYAGRVTVGIGPIDNMDLTTKQYVDEALSHTTTSEDTHVEVSSELLRSNKAYLLATKAYPTTTPQSVTSIADTGVYLDVAKGAFTIGARNTGRTVGSNTLANGNNVVATGTYSHAEGTASEAKGSYSHAEGNGSVAEGMASHAEGSEAKASGRFSHSEGVWTIANGEAQHASGKYNVADNNNTYVEIVGNGTSTSARSNARTLDWSGNAVYAGKVTVGAGPTGDMDLATKQYVDEAVDNVTVDDAQTVNGHTVESDVPANAVFTDTTYTDATTSSAGLMSASDKTKLSRLNVYFGTCNTTSDIAEKEVVLTNGDGFELVPGTIVGVKFTYGNNASNSTLNVNGTGAKSIWVANSELVAPDRIYSGEAGFVLYYMYDGSHWAYLGLNYFSDTRGVAYCTTSANNANKYCYQDRYTLRANNYINVVIRYDNTAQSALTFNIIGTGAKPIYINGEPSSATNYILPAGAYIVYYDGDYYQFRTDGKIPGPGIMGDAATVNNHTINSDVPANAVFTDTTYSDATTSSSGLMSATDKTKLNGITSGAVPNYFGVCSDSGTTLTVTVDSSFTLAEGAMVNVFFENQSASQATLNVNDTGPYPIYIYGTQQVSNAMAWGWRSGQLVELVFHDSKWFVQNQYFNNAGTGSSGLMAGWHVEKLDSLDPNSTAPISLWDEDLNDIHPTSTTWYYSGGGNHCTNKPSDNFSSFGMVCFRTATGYITQLFWPTGWAYYFCRTWNGSSWSNWISIGKEASSSENGLMSVTDKNNLDGIVGTQLTNEDLNNIHPGHFAVYWADTDNTCTHKPTAISVYAFALICLKTTSAYQLQVLFHPTSNRQWRRYWNGSSWSGWGEITYSWAAARTYNGLMSAADKVKLDDLKASTINVTDTYGVAGTAGATVTIQALMDAIASKV